MLARFDAAATQQRSPLHTPVLNRVSEAPPVHRKLSFMKSSDRGAPRTLAQDKWFYVEDLNLTLGRVVEQTGYKVRLDNDDIFVIEGHVIRRGRYARRSLSGMVFAITDMHC